MRWRRAGGLILLLASLAGCRAASGSPPPTTHALATATAVVTSAAPSEAETSSAPASPSAVPAESAPAPTQEPTAEPPPQATLVAGGVERTGEVGSYVWGSFSSSAPWLPASALEPLPVAPGAEVSVAVAGDHPVDQWTASAATVDDPQAETVIPVGAGRGRPRFTVPASGPMVVAVHVVFANGAGDAVYYWHLDTQ